MSKSQSKNIKAAHDDEHVRLSPISLAALALIVLVALGGIVWAIAAHFRSTDTVTDDTVMSCTDFTGDPLDYVTPPASFEGIKIDGSVLDRMYNEHIDAIRLAFVSYTDSTAADKVGLWDRVTVSYSGTPVGIDAGSDVLAALSVGNYRLVVGDTDFFPAYESKSDPAASTRSFSEQLVGSHVGDTLTLTVTCADGIKLGGIEYSELYGRQIAFEVTVQSLEKAMLPELTDALVSEYSNGSITSVSQLKSEFYSLNRAYLAFDALCDAITVKSYPGELVDREIVSYIRSIIESERDVDTIGDDELRDYTDKYYDEAYSYAMDAVGERLKLEYLLDVCKVKLTVAEYNRYIDEDFREGYTAYMTSFGIDSAKGLEDIFGRDYLILKYSYFELLDVVSGLVEFE